MEIGTAHGPLAYMILAMIAIYRLPRFGRAVIDFLRDLDRYRATRPKR
jgi:hypothetical protein